MNIKLYQIYYDSIHLEHLSDRCEHIFNPPGKNIRNNMRESPVMLAHEQDCMNHEQLTGFISWKFKNKAKISVDDYINKIQIKPGYDVYFKDCGRQKWDSVWVQGEKYHPGIVEFTKKIFKKINYNIDISSTKLPKQDAQCFCNFITGNRYFWLKYFEFIKPVVNHINNHLTEEDSVFLYKKADKKIDSNLAPFIYERLFSTLLYVDASIKYCRL